MKIKSDVGRIAFNYEGGGMLVIHNKVSLVLYPGMTTGYNFIRKGIFDNFVKWHRFVEVK